jgi:hypothetical protein
MSSALPPLMSRESANSELSTMMNNDRPENHTMRRLGFVVALLGILAAGASFGGCGNPQPAINTVGTNVIEKSTFAGSWYMTEQIIDFDYEAASLGFVGEISGDGTAGGYGMARVRWVIDQEMLYAYRDYLTVPDAADPHADQPADFLGQPIAAYRITSHFDIRRVYNPTTGEEQNIIQENTTDRRWWERQFMRVDWSRNLISGWYGTSNDVSELFGDVRREPADIFISPESDFPDAWRPQFHVMSCNGLEDHNCSGNDQLWAGDYAQGDLYSMSFVTQQLLSPGGPYALYCGNPGFPPCSSVPVAVRTSFLRVSDQRDYDPMQYDDAYFDRAGYFRLERETYDHSVATEDHTDAGDVAWGSTDFRNQAAFRFNLWRQWRDAAGSAIPYRDRDIRPIHWVTSRELPGHLVRPAFEAVGEWNAVLMGVVRERRVSDAGTLVTAQPTYPRVSCQTDDPAAYCYCQETLPGSGDYVNPTCAGRYNPFQRPTAAVPYAVDAGATIQNPFDCWVGFGAPGAEQSLDELRGTPNDPEPDWNDPALDRSRFDRWFGAHVVGTECADILAVNTCNIAAVAANGGTADGLECQERGDIRFSLLSFVDQAGTPFLGVAQFRADPVSGELFGADANIGGPALNGYRTRALQAFDLIQGRLTDQEFYTGEDIRAFLEASNHVDLPAPPRIDYSVAGLEGLDSATPGVSAELTNRMEATMARAERLQGPEGRAAIYSDRLTRLAGTDIESRLLDNDETAVLAGQNLLLDRASTALDETTLDAASPFRGALTESLQSGILSNYRIAAAGLHMPNEFVDDSVLWYVNRSAQAGWTRAHVEFDIDRRLYRQTEIHEMGHCHGLRHDYGGSADSDNYAPEYYQIAAEHPLPRPADFEVDSTPGFSLDEQRAYEDAYTTARHNREIAGIDAWMVSSIMDYTGNWYERIQGSGQHDWMAIALGYGGLVDLYHNTEGVALEDVNPSSASRVYATYYRGGATCAVDDDCAYAAGGERSADLTPANTSSGLTQRCVAHPTVHGRSVCSNFDDDASTLTASFTAGSAPEWIPVSYRYCEDYRGVLRTLPWCNQFDEGDSYREMVRNAQEGYDRAYIFSAFRRYRRTFSTGTYVQSLLRYLMPLINIEQNLLYEYQSNPAFRTQRGAWGFEDEFLATADILNFFARVLSSPAVGPYNYDTGYERYIRSGNDPDAPSTQLPVRLGEGRYYYSIYQAGLTGVNRIERIGVFIDKIYTMILMTTRGLAPFYGPDTQFYSNMYDLFPNEINQMFTGMISERPDQYMPRVTCGAGVFPRCDEPRITYMDFYRGDCGPTATAASCRPDPAAITYNPDLVPGMYVLDGNAGVLLQSYAAIFGLAEFPVYYDTSFETQLFMCVEGEGDCQLPGPDPDGDGDIDGDGNTDYVRYTSLRLGQSYLAWQLDPATVTISQRSVAFSMVEEARDGAFIQLALQVYRGDFGGPGGPRSTLNFTGPYAGFGARLAALGYTIPPAAADQNREIDRLSTRVENLESFFNYLIQIEREYGVAFPALWRRPSVGL